VQERRQVTAQLEPHFAPALARVDEDRVDHRPQRFGRLRCRSRVGQRRFQSGHLVAVDVATRNDVRPDAQSRGAFDAH